MDLQARLSDALGSRYAIEEEIGRGGMAVVFRAHDRKHDRRVAVKVFRPELSAALGSERFLHEIQVTAQLQHPHIVPLHDSGAAGGLLYYIMPHVVGETLRSRLARETQLPVDEALAIAHNIADALSHAHSLGVVHRDIKPENILLSGGHAVVADFGVAGAISAAAHPGRLTQPDLAVGTPAYMSPEQAAGAEALDGRSDLFSLGCVLYEMLAGEAPYSAATAQAMAARDLAQSPLHVVRPSVSSELERAVERALAPLPADRFRTAEDMIVALRAATRETEGSALARPPRRRRAGMVAVAMFAAAALFVVVSRTSTSVPLDDSLYVVFPFEHRVGAAPGLVSGDQCELEITNVLRGFQDARTVEHFLVADAIRRRGDGVLSSDEAIAVARELGGRWLVRGEVVSVNDSTLVRATLFDARGGRVRGQATIGLSGDGQKLTGRFRLLVADLLDLPAIAAATGSATSLAANRRFVEGRRALTSGDLSRAAVEFREAATLDTSFAAAHMWAAQVGAWRRAPPTEWRAAAREARELLRAEPEGRDHRLATALLALADGRFQDACGEYRALLARDSTDWMAWVGLGECQAGDTVVVRDAASRSGWSFRGSRQAGIDAYGRALGLTAFLTPVLYERLAAVIPVEIGRLRRGAPAAPDTGLFLSYPGFAGDTFAYVPYRAEAVQRGTTDDTTTGLAAARGRARLRDLVAQWAAAYPASAAAQAKLSETLERFGQIAMGGGTPAALDAIRTARRLATDSIDATRYAVAEARLELKAGDVRRAAMLADSLLDRWPDPPPELAEPLAVMAVLTGRAGRAAAALARNAITARDHYRDAAVRALPVPIFEARERARAFAALGTPRDSLERWLGEVDRRLAAAMGALGRSEARAALLTNPLMWAFPTLGASALHRPEAPEYLLGMQALAGRGARAELRARFASLAEARQDVPAGAVALGAVFQESHLLLGLGDTAAATAHLATALDALPMSGTMLTDDVVDAAALVRAMALRARLALAARDTSTAVRWARLVTLLWAAADPAVRSTVDDLFTFVSRATPPR